MGRPKFKVLIPKTLDEALEMKKNYGDKARIYAGGTDLLIRMNQGVIKPEYVLYIGGLDELRYVKFSPGDGLKIGASATLSDVLEEEATIKYYPALYNAIENMATTQVRNKATVIGNLCNAAPSADTAPPLIAYGSEVVIRSADGERVVPLEDFFKGPGITDLRENEMVVEVRVPPQEDKSFTSYVKFSHRSRVDIAIVGVAAKVLKENGVCKDARIVLGAVAPVPMRAKRAEDFVKGKSIDESVADEAGKIASEESKPITDVRATKEYRRHLVGVLTKRALVFSFDKAGG